MFSNFSSVCLNSHDLYQPDNREQQAVCRAEVESAAFLIA